jgi:hypothetical protein
MAGTASIDEQITALLKLAFEGRNLSWVEEGQMRDILLLSLRFRASEITPAQRAQIERLLEHKSTMVIAAAATFFKLCEMEEALPALHKACENLLSRNQDADRWEETKTVEAAISAIEDVHFSKVREMKLAAQRVSPAISSMSAYTRDMEHPKASGGQPKTPGPQAGKGSKAKL